MKLRASLYLRDLYCRVRSSFVQEFLDLSPGVSTELFRSFLNSLMVKSFSLPFNSAQTGRDRQIGFNVAPVYPFFSVLNLFVVSFTFIKATEIGSTLHNSLKYF